MMYGVPATPAPVVSAIGQRRRCRGGRVAARGSNRFFQRNENPKWNTIRGDALLSPGQPLRLVVDRNGQRIPLTITPTAVTEDGETAGILDFVPDYGEVPVVVRGGCA